MSAAVDAAFVAGWIDATIPVQGALEDALVAAEDERVQSMLAPHHHRVADLEDDVRRLGFVPGTFEVPDCVDSFAESFRSIDPARLVGRWYVFEGATNGGRLIGPHVGRTLDPDDPPHLAFFDPHREHQSARWQTFRQGLDAFTDDVGPCIDGALEAFAFHGALFDARWARRGEAGR